MSKSLHETEESSSMVRRACQWDIPHSGVNYTVTLANWSKQCQYTQDESSHWHLLCVNTQYGSSCMYSPALITPNSRKKSTCMLKYMIIQLFCHLLCCVSEPHTRNVNVSEPHTWNVNVSEPHTRNVNVSEPHTRNVNVSEPHTWNVNVSEPHTRK